MASASIGKDEDADACDADSAPEADPRPELLSQEEGPREPVPEAEAEAHSEDCENELSGIRSAAPDDGGSAGIKEAVDDAVDPEAPGHKDRTAADSSCLDKEGGA